MSQTSMLTLTLHKTLTILLFSAWKKTYRIENDLYKRPVIMTTDMKDCPVKKSLVHYSERGANFHSVGL